MATFKKWSPEDVNTLIDQVNRHPHCLRKAFENTARLLERTPTACSQKWYTIAADDSTKTCFAFITSKSKSKNKKVPKKVEQKDRITCTIFKKLLTLLGLR